MSVVLLLLHLLARDVQVFAVGADDVVAAVSAGIVNWLGLAAKDHGNL